MSGLSSCTCLCGSEEEEEEEEIEEEIEEIEEEIEEVGGGGIEGHILMMQLASKPINHQMKEMELGQR